MAEQPVANPVVLSFAKVPGRTGPLTFRVTVMNLINTDAFRGYGIVQVMGRCAVGFLLACSASHLNADTVEISGGGHLTGKVDRRKEATIVKIDDELQVAIRPSRVSRVVKSEDLANYHARAAKLGDDAELHYQHGIWCVTGNNVPGNSKHYKRFHMERAVELDPDHANARAQLGYKKHEGKWVLTSELMRDRGMISKAGRWEVPEAVALEEAQDTSNTDAKKWIREVARLTKVAFKKSNLTRDQTKSQEAMDALKAIDDPLAATAIAKQLADSRGNRSQSRAMRMLWVDLLGKFRTTVSVRALVLAGIEEEDELIRQRALDKLVDYGSASAVMTYLPMLKSNNNKTVNRAARALSWFPDPELALDYVNALVTEHSRMVAPGPGTQAGFGGGSNTSGGTFSQGSQKPKKITETLTNPAVLSLVKTIEPAADFGYDEKAWKYHFAQQRSNFSGDLRRDQ